MENICGRLTNIFGYISRIFVQLNSNDQCQSNGWLVSANDSIYACYFTYILPRLQQILLCLSWTCRTIGMISLNLWGKQRTGSHFYFGKWACIIPCMTIMTVPNFDPRNRIYSQETDYCRHVNGRAKYP